MKQHSRYEELGRSFGRAGLALMLPVVMAVTPVVGWLLGLWIGRWIGWEPLKYVGLGLGIASGLRQSIDIVKKLGSIDAPRSDRQPPPPPTA